MFTWECQKCGREVDISDAECPVCRVGEHPAPAAAAPPAPQPHASAPSAPPPAVEGAAPQARSEARPEAAPPAKQPSEPPPPPQAPPQAQAPMPPAPAQSRPAGPAPPPPPPPPAPHQAFALKASHVGIFVGVLALAVIGALYSARPEMFSFEMPSLASSSEAAPVEIGGAVDGDIEVAGARLWREDGKATLRAVVVNHGEEALDRVELIIRVWSLNEEPPAKIATVVARLDKGLGSRSSREIEADLGDEAAARPLPSRDRIRVEIEKLP